jgi:hypothetical protein
VRDVFGQSFGSHRKSFVVYRARARIPHCWPSEIGRTEAERRLRNPLSNEASIQTAPHAQGVRRHPH